MADKFNKNNGSDDINEFFSQFDEPIDETSSKHNKKTEPQKSRSVTPSRASRSKSQKDSKAPRKKKGTRSAKAKKNKHKLSFFTYNRQGELLSTKQKALRIALTAIIALFIILFIYVGVLIITADTHSIDADNIYSKLSQRSTLYDDQGDEIESVFSEDGNRANVSYDQLPENLINAIVSIEDKTFWKHHGFNFVRIAGAIKDSVFGGGQISGTSTLTQQLARNVYLAETKSTRSMNRKILEAYYTVLIEKSMTKEQIIEAYLNTVSLGFNCYGVEAASQAYFGKSVTELDLQECVALASLPQSPSSFALVKSYPIGTVEVDQDNIISTTDSMIYVYNGELSSNRRSMTFNNMVDQGYITQSEADEAKNQNLKDKIDISTHETTNYSTYFTDYAIDQITEDIMEEYGWTKEEARNRIYTGGLKIYTTMDSNAQQIAYKEFSNSSNFPSVANLRKDSDGNVLNGKTGSIILYDYDDYFDDNGNFVLAADEYSMNSDGSMTLYAGKRLNFYNTTVNGGTDISVEFKKMYEQKDGKFYTIEGGTLAIPQEYKSKDASGNCIISAEFFKENPNFFKKKDGTLILSEKGYSLKQRVVQPQAAAVVIDYKTGGIKAMIGGRDVSGRMVTNRALQPNQPGSSIKPLAVYSSALQSSFNAEAKGEKMNLSKSQGDNWGDYITAGSVINDAPLTVNGKTWPKNWYSGYRGHMTLRKAVEQSVNVCAVKVYQQMGPEFPISQLKKMGITTIVEDGDVNDKNPAALALGGMTTGISPLQMAAAYGIFPNEGTYTEPIAYTKITNSNDEVIFEKTPETEEVLNEGVAYIMTDILRSVVTNGLGSTASFSGQPVAGKTGTTNDNYDAWFVGFTPQYSASVWIGNDVNIELSQGSASAARLWRSIMSQVCEGLPYGEYPSKPDNVESHGGEYYTEGTYSRVSKPTSKTQKTTEEKKDETKETTQAPTQAPTTQAPTTQPTTQASATEPETPSHEEDD